MEEHDSFQDIVMGQRMANLRNAVDFNKQSNNGKTFPPELLRK
jgi:hypothetical protein